MQLPVRMRLAHSMLAVASCALHTASCAVAAFGNTIGCVLQVDISVTPGTHATEAAVNKQLNDKERVAAALENPNLADMVNRCLASSH